MKGLTLSEPMVRAWLAGNKSVTRRLMKPQPVGHSWEYNPSHRLEHMMLLTNKGWYCKFWHSIAQNPLPDGEQWIRAPYQPGETVYIKETCQAYQMPIEAAKGGFNGFTTHIRYCDGTESKCWAGIKWPKKPVDFDLPAKGFVVSSRFMPAWAARSHALIKSVRPERMQEITTRECVREGMVCGSILDDNNEDVLREVRESKSCLVAAALLKTSGIPPRKQFMALWESLYPGSWEKNEWCWRIEMEKQ